MLFRSPKLVKSQLRKMSGVFSSFLTPEKRMVRRIAELARDKRTYFGCLVQDYVSFLQENKECHVSSTDLLQTIRQFMTQVKNYLSQSSELDPPIESLIPEDQIGGCHLAFKIHVCVYRIAYTYQWNYLKTEIHSRRKKLRVIKGGRGGRERWGVWD